MSFNISQNELNMKNSLNNSIKNIKKSIKDSNIINNNINNITNKNKFTASRTNSLARKDTIKSKTKNIKQTNKIIRSKSF